MERKLIKIEFDNYVLEEIEINKQLIFYNKSNKSNNIDISMFECLYLKYMFEKLLFGDTTIINDIIFNYTDNKIVTYLYSFKNKIKTR